MSKGNPLWLAATATAYILGVATGILAVRLRMERKYRKIADEEVESVKEAFRRKEAESKADRMSEENKRKLNEVYSALIAERKYAQRDEPEDAVVISTEEYGMDGGHPDYECRTITYYEGNGVFVDDLTETVLSDEEWESMLGCGVVKHFGENEDDEDAVYIRNDARRAYYEVIRNEEAYEE